MVSATKINAHIDANCPDPGVELLRSSDSLKHQMSPVKSNTNHNKPMTSPQQPGKLAPLFAPKQQAPPPLARPEKTIVEPTASTKRNIEESTITPPIKRKKTDTATEAMPLAAKGTLFFYKT